MITCFCFVIVFVFFTFNMNVPECTPQSVRNFFYLLIFTSTLRGISNWKLNMADTYVIATGRNKYPFLLLLSTQRLALIVSSEAHLIFVVDILCDFCIYARPCPWTQFIYLILFLHWLFLYLFHDAVSPELFENVLFE